MPEKEQIASWLAWRMDETASQDETRAAEKSEKSILENAAVCIGCSIVSTRKFGDHLGVGYLVGNHAQKSFWIWGADRPMKNEAEIQAHFEQQLRAGLQAGSC